MGAKVMRCTIMLVSSDPDEVSFDHNFARLERLLRAPEDPEDIPKVCPLVTQQVFNIHIQQVCH